MRPLTARERRLLALGLVVVAAGLVWLLIIGPLVTGFLDRAAERRDLRGAYSRNERLIASLPALRAADEAQRRGAGRFTLVAPSETLALEALKERLQHLSVQDGFAVNALADLQADARPDTVKLRADLTLTLTQLYDAIRHLEGEETYVVVDYLSVTADRSLAAHRLEPIDVRLEISAAWRPGRGRP